MALSDAKPYAACADRPIADRAALRLGRSEDRGLISNFQIHTCKY